MKLIRASATIEAGPVGSDAIALLEKCGRTCYQSECKGDPESFINRILHQNHHESVIEHVSWTVRFVIDRGVSHELVRHRLASFSQESQRYVDQGKKGEWTFILPEWLADKVEAEGENGWRGTNRAAVEWLSHLAQSVDSYRLLRGEGWTPQQARSVLPNAVKTEVWMTANAREWRHVFKLRCHESAHPDMRSVMIPLLASFKAQVPVLFDDL